MNSKQLKIICFFLYRIWSQLKDQDDTDNFLQMYSQAERYADRLEEEIL